MTTRNYHTPPQPGSTRARCPVCHEAVYSRAGIHPQCAVRQSDPPRPKNVPAVAAVESVPDAEPDIVAVAVEVEDVELEAVPVLAAPAKRRRG